MDGWVRDGQTSRQIDKWTLNKRTDECIHFDSERSTTYLWFAKILLLASMVLLADIVISVLQPVV